MYQTVMQRSVYISALSGVVVGLFSSLDALGNGSKQASVDSGYHAGEITACVNAVQIGALVGSIIGLTSVIYTNLHAKQADNRLKARNSFEIIIRSTLSCILISSVIGGFFGAINGAIGTVLGKSDRALRTTLNKVDSIVNEVGIDGQVALSAVTRAANDTDALVRGLSGQAVRLE